MSKLFPTASRLGFGCASLGSRIGPGRGLIALAAAFERGINWFDLAPSYGDGRAETIFADFVRGRRDKIHICTKCGIEPPRIMPVAKFLKPLVRAVVSKIPNARQIVARGRSAAQSVELTPSLIRDSLHRSLSRLGTDYVDVLALHEPSLGDLAREDIVDTLDALVKAGKVRAVGVAGRIDAVEAAAQMGRHWTHFQFPSGPESDAMERLRLILGDRVDDLSIALFSVFGTIDLARLHGAERMFLDAGYTMPLQETLRAAALDLALLKNRNGTILLSMFTKNHVDFAVSRLEHFDSARPEILFRAIQERLGEEAALQARIAKA